MTRPRRATDLSGLVAVVTGGNQGIGLVLARGLGQAGADVAVWSRTAERNDLACAELRDLGVRALPVTCDVTDEDQVAAAMRRTVEELGPLGCMVANAGVADAAPLKPRARPGCSGSGAPSPSSSLVTGCAATSSSPAGPTHR